MGNEIDYNELFGIEDGIEESEVEDKTSTSDAEDDADTKAQDSDSVDNDDASEDTEGTPHRAFTTRGEDDSDDSDNEDAQSPEENKRYAAARRKAEKERDIAVQKARDDARADADRYIAEAVKSLGIKNPYTGKLIETKAELDEYNAKMNESRKNEFIKRSGMSDEEYKRFVENLPEVAEARAEKERARLAGIEANRERAKAALDEEVKKISKLDSSIRTVEDITKLENYSEIYERVKRGYSLYDAYLSVNHARLSDRSAATARQKALNDMSAKEHLTASSTRGNGAVSVPKDIADAYREFNPKATDAEIIKHYNKYLNGKR